MRTQENSMPWRHDVEVKGTFRPNDKEKNEKQTKALDAKFLV